MTGTTSEMPPQTARPSRRTRTPRGRRGTVATVTALLAVAVCAAGAAEAISLAMHRRALVLHVGAVAKYGRDTRLDDPVVLVVAVIAFAVGILLLLAALVPPRRRLVELAEPDPAVAAGLTPRSFRRTLAAAALEVDGIGSAKVTGRRRLAVKVSTSFRDTDALPGRVRDRVVARLGELNPATARRVRVTLTRRDG